MIYAPMVLSLATIAVFAVLIKIRLGSMINCSFPRLFLNKNPFFFPNKNPIFYPPIDPVDVLCTEKNKDDLISKLPDDILISIISRLSTKVATRTSLLSRRWRNLYRSVPQLELHCFNLLKHNEPISYGIRNMTSISSQNSELIMNALDSLLRLRSGSKIRSFRLTSCLNKSVTDRFELFISSLGRLGVEKLFLECCCRLDGFCCCWCILDLPFSCHLFSKMPSLKEFGLSRCCLQPSVGSQYNNNSLQNIVLMDVKVSHGAVECILSTCSMLQSLTITSCKCPSKLKFCGSHLELKSLYIKECEGVEEIEFHASNLVVFEFWSPKLVNLKFDHVPKLQSIFLYICKENIVPYICGRLAIDLPDLKSLNFVTTGGNFQESNTNTRMGMNMLSNLRRLDIDLRSVPKIDLCLLTSFLQSCPLLQEFHLTIKLCDNGSRVEKQAVVSHSELKKMEIRGFGGTKYEIELALYILKSATRLEKMHISTSHIVYEGPGWSWTPVHRWSEKTRAEIHRTLQGQAVSKTVQLSIQYRPSYSIH